MLTADALIVKYNAMPSSDKELLSSLAVYLEEGEMYRKGTFWGIMGAMSFRTPEFCQPFHIMSETEKAAYMRRVWEEIRSFEKKFC